MLPLEDSSSGYAFQGMTGLDPVEANIVTSGYANHDGVQYHAARRELRDMQLDLGLEPNPASQTVSQLRNNLYRYCLPKSEVNLRFNRDDEPSVSIDARVKDFESPLFAQEPVATISFEAHDPDFVEDTPVIFSGATTSGTNHAVLDYEGSVETGFLFRMPVNRALSSFRIINQAPNGETRDLEFTLPSGVPALAAGEVIEISTVFGAKRATRIVTASGTTSSVLYGVSPYADWVNIFPGENNIRVYADGAAIPFTIEYQIRHGGL